MAQYSSMAQSNEVETLISLVQERAYLWEKPHPDYRDTVTTKAENWRDFAECLAKGFPPLRLDRLADTRHQIN